MPKCLACAEPIKVGDKYYNDVSGDLIHDKCTADDSFVDLETEAPLTYRPTPHVWTQQDQDTEDADAEALPTTATGETIQ
ncbi:hypothetical protein [Brevundimonas sp.]|uniref:hypothetical protein n=1 Tax=Brevundimonas sp. TaxID=1871086 RepID=UPI002897DB86|nr:hypothetical protein [Brevundimonas sp.]